MLRLVSKSADASLCEVRWLAEQAVNNPQRIFAGRRALGPVRESQRPRGKVFQPWRMKWAAYMDQSVSYLQDVVVYHD